MAVDDASRRPPQAYATVSPVGVGATMTSQKEKTLVSLLNGPLSKLNCLKFKRELLQRMDSLYAFYHKQWWCYRRMLNHFKFYNALFNGMVLLVMAAGMIAGSILENSTLVACLTAVGTVVKGWNDFKKYSFKVDMSRFAFTTYAKALIELRTYVRGIPFEGLEGCLIKMQTLYDTIIDFTPPLPKRCVQEYYRQFFYQPVDAQCYVDGCHRPLMSKSYWAEKDKKVSPYTPTLMYSGPCPPAENEKEEEQEENVVVT